MRSLLLSGVLLMGVAKGLAQIPTNDLCSSFVTLTNGVPYSMNTSQATEHSEPASVGGYNFGRGVWFAVTPTIDQRVDIDTAGSGFVTALGVYTNQCDLNSYAKYYNGSAVAANGSGQASVSFSGKANKTYYVLAGGYFAAGGNLTIKATLGSTPTNDICNQPVVLTNGVPYVMNTYAATEFGEPASVGGYDFGRGVWFAVTPTIDQRVDIDTAGSGFVTALGVYTNLCDLTSYAKYYNGGAVAANGSGQASVSFSGQANKTYYVLAGGYFGGGGNLTIKATLGSTPTNDICSQPVVLTNGIPYVINTAPATEFGEPASLGGYNFGRGVWFAVTTTIDQRVDIDTAGSGFITGLGVYTNLCDLNSYAKYYNGAAVAANGSGQASVSFTGQANKTYYVLAGGYFGAGGNLTIKATLGSTPTNDICSQPVVLTNGVPYVMNTYVATEHNEPGSLGGYNFGRGVWFAVTTTIDQRVDIDTAGSGFITGLGVYTNLCDLNSYAKYYNGGAVAANGSGQASVSFSGQANKTYYVLAGGYFGAGGNLTIKATLGSTPTNDICSQPVVLTNGVPYVMNTYAATEFGEPASLGGYNFGRGVWFAVTTTSDQRVDIDTTGSGFITGLGVYTNLCDLNSYAKYYNGGAVAANGSGQASVSFSGQANKTYYVLAGGYFEGGGNLTIKATLGNTPTNDICSQPVVLTNGVPYVMNTYAATEFGEPTTIASQSFGRGVWFAVTPTNNHQVVITTEDSTFTTGLAVYTNLCNYSANLLNTNGNIVWVNGSAPGAVSFNGVSNRTYYILVGGYFGGGGTLKITYDPIPGIDLVTASLTATNVAGGLVMVGMPLQVQWRVVNQGTNPASTFWTDELVLSNALTQVVYPFQTFSRTRNVATNAFYTNEISAYVQAMPAGNYYLVGRIDRDKQVFETTATNNLVMLPLTITNAAGLVTLTGPTSNVERTNCVAIRLKLTATTVAKSYTITNIAFYDNGSLISQGPNQNQTVATFTHGTHAITAKVLDNYGLEGVSTQQVTIGIRWPTNLHRLQADTATNGDFVGCMCAYSGSNYWVQFTTNLNGNPNWQTYGTNVAVNSVLSFTNSVGSLRTNGQRYFRVRQLW